MFVEYKKRSLCVYRRFGMTRWRPPIIDMEILAQTKASVPVRPLERPPVVGLGISLCPTVGKVLKGLFGVLLGGGIPCDSTTSCLKWVECKAARYLIQKLDDEIVKIGTEICDYMAKEADEVCVNMCKGLGVIGFGITGYCTSGCEAMVQLGKQDCIKYIDSIVGEIPPATGGCGYKKALLGDEKALDCWKCKAVRKGVDDVYEAMQAEADKACIVLVKSLAGFAKSAFHITVPDAFLQPAMSACETFVADYMGGKLPPVTSVDFKCAAVSYLVDKAEAEIKYLEDSAIQQFLHFPRAPHRSVVPGHSAATLHEILHHDRRRLESCRRQVQ